MPSYPKETITPSPFREKEPSQMPPFRERGVWGDFPRPPSQKGRRTMAWSRGDPLLQERGTRINVPSVKLGLERGEIPLNPPFAKGGE